MAKRVYKNALVTVNAVNLSSWCSSVTIETARDEVDVTSMGATNKETIMGLGDATITLDLFQDYAAGGPDATLFPLSTTDTPFTVAIRPENAAVSSTNPEYQMSALMSGYTPVAASVGEGGSFSVSFRNASQTGLVRDVTP